MATRKKTIKTEEVEIEKAKGIDEPERFRLGSIGYSGLKIFDGVVESEMVKELQYPESNKTYKKMLLHPAVNASINLHKTLVSKATYRVVEPKDATEEEKQRTEIVRQMLFEDMESSIDSVIAEAMTMVDYGFAPLEKVFRRRTKDSGSIYNDGLIGVRKLALRHQESIEKFIFDDDGEYVTGIKQDIALLSDPYNRFSRKANTSIVIPRSKFLLFTAGDTKTNPFGTSPLRNVYLPFRYLNAIEELEASGVSKDLAGLPMLSIPAQYMSPDASPEQKQFYSWCQNIVRNIQTNSQSGLVMPLLYDPETRQPMFKMELLSTEGTGKNYDTTKIKDYYRAMIFVGLSADILMMGLTNTGSFNLGSIKSSLTGQAVERHLNHIVEVLNRDLIRQIYTLNNWDVSRCCKLDVEGFEDLDLETFSKAIQRIKSVALLPSTLDVTNNIMRSLGLDELPEDTTQEELDKLLGDSTSRAGDGMKTAGDGTSNSNFNSNDSNLENVG